ncbi:MAG: DUF1049 domain-containing protein [Defluviicoccus sp.]|nr:MAG: DUF1049 domain-containing protein [Defluviicoccus sp.]
MGRVLYWIAFIPLCLVVIVFSVSNHATAELSLWPVLTDPVPFPVYGIALVALFAGFVLGGIVAWFQGGSRRRLTRELRRRSEQEQREIAKLRERLNRLEASNRQATIPPPPAPVVSRAPAATAPSAPSPSATSPQTASPEVSPER